MRQKLQIPLSIFSAFFTVASQVAGIINFLPSFNWQICALIGFVVFILTIGWIIWGKQSEIDALRNTKPSISTEVIKQSHKCYIRVKNNGAKGIFKAQIRMDTNDPAFLDTSNYYNGIWDNDKDIATIFNGQENYIKIARRMTTPLPSTTECLYILRYDCEDNMPRHFKTSAYIPGSYYTDPDGNETPMERYEYNLRIKISSDPSLQEGVYEKCYTLSLRNFVEYQPCP